MKDMKGYTEQTDKSHPAFPDEMAAIELDDEVCFFVDFVKLHLREHVNPENIIPLASMKDTGTTYEFIYDPNTRGVASTETNDSPDNYKVTVSHLTRMHPEAMAHIYNVPVEEVKKRNDKEFFRDLKQIRKKEQKKKTKIKRGKGI